MRKSLNRLVVLLVTACFLHFDSTASAWIDTGHKIVALIAWNELTPKTREAALAMLKQHPRYEQDLLFDRPKDATDEELARHAFADAATWPDTVRSQNNPMHNVYHHPEWHYIDIPYLVGGATAPVEKNAGTKGPHNIVEALQKNSADIRNPSISPSDKAIALCWVLHLVGDIHQPLHAAMMVSPKFPEGDRGGNSIQVLRDPPYPNSRMNLHLLWDELPGQFKSDAFDGYEAAGILADADLSREKLKDLLAVTDFMAWAKESNALAVEYAYLNGKLPGLDGAKDAAGARGNPPGVPPDYIENAEKVAAHQIALAGLRLADLLNATFDPK